MREPARQDDLDAPRGIINAIAMVAASIILGVLLAPIIFVVCGWWR